MTSSSAASVPFTVTVRTSGAVSTVATVTAGTLPAGSGGSAADDCTPHAASVTANRGIRRAARNRWRDRYNVAWDARGSGDGCDA